MALNTSGSSRDSLAFADKDRTGRDRRIGDLIQNQVLVGDPRRWRPRWFDGRFLAASDLLAEQNYFMVRQADLGRASGSGIVEGLSVSVVAGSDRSADQVRIAPGHGITDTGALITLFDALSINPADVPEMRRIDAAFGLQVIPDEPGHLRTGLYVLALRPVEWTANPIGAYPTSLTGPRTVEDGTIVEGVAVSLIPYPDTGNEETWERRRARVAREIFVEGRDRGLRGGVLPLAMVALRGNTVAWVDPFMVRRETGAERPAGMDFGFGARALREAHLLQYGQHLADALNAHNNQPFQAADYFDALPPVGRFPSGAINPTRLTQRFFPAGVEVDLSFVPDDELPALIEESLLLPPIDLTLDAEGLRGTGVVVLVPLSRADFAANRSSLPNWTDQPARLTAGFTQLKALATPRELLLSRLFRPVAVPTPPTEEEAWRQLLNTALSEPSLLWYVRRRHLPIPSNVAGTPVDATSARLEDPAMLLDTVREHRVVRERLVRVTELNTPETNAFSRRLANPSVARNLPLVRSLLVRAAGTEEKPTAASVIEALGPATDPKLGEGLERLAAANDILGGRLAEDSIADTGLLSDIDKLAREIPEEKLEVLTAGLRDVLGRRGSSAPEKLEERIKELSKELGR